MLLRKAMTTPDTLNAITFQISNRSATVKSGSRTVTLDANVVKDIETSLLESANWLNLQEILYKEVHERDKGHMILKYGEQRLYNDAPSINLKYALFKLRNVRIEIPVEWKEAIYTIMDSHVVPRKGELDRKKEYWRRQKDDKWFVCGREGHWFKDREDLVRDRLYKFAQRK